MPVDAKEGTIDDPSAAVAQQPTQKKRTGKPSRTLARRIIRWVLTVWLVVLVVVTTIVVIRTLLFDSKQLSVQKVEVAMQPPEQMAQRLAESLRFVTVSEDDAVVAAKALYGLHEHLRVSFPLVHTTLVRENVADYSLLYTWRGSSPELPALILAAHMDVVPADPTKWSYPPFSGMITEGFIYGRGALDDKVSVLGILEAIEQLLREGFVPKRTIYIAFGHDEEIGGNKGAKSIAELLAARGVRAEATIDEGLVITEGILDGIDQPVALIGIAEKGLMNLQLLVKSEGGHSSMPGETAIGILSHAIVALQNNPMPATFSGAVDEMFSYVGPEFGFGQKLVMANLWLFGPIVRGRLAEKPATDALLRTTTAPTIMQSGLKSNVLPQEAQATVNFRIKPGDTGEDVLHHVSRVIDDKRIDIQTIDFFDPPPSSSSQSRVFEIMVRGIRSIDPEIIVAPGLMLGFTDSRHYADISNDVYRFTALRFRSEDLRRLHGVDERVSIKNYAELVGFNILLLRNAGGQ